jgi:4-amino-4-deoxy-L-arabinose transferase-like glycosyltransferase
MAPQTGTNSVDISKMLVVNSSGEVPTVGVRSGFGKQRLVVALMLLLILAAAALVRALNLGYPTLFMDEYDHVYAAQSILKTGKPELPSGYQYTRALPYTLLVAASFKLFGVSEASARVPSVIFGVLMVLGAFLLGAYFHNAYTGLLAAFLTAFLPLPVGWSRECRMYSTFAFLYALLVLCFYKGFEPEGKADVPKHSLKSMDFRWLIGAGVLLALAYSVQMLAGLFFFGMAAYCALMFVFLWAKQGIKTAVASKYSAVLLLGLASFAVFASTPMLEKFWKLSQECPPYARWKARMYSFYLPVLFDSRFHWLALLGAGILSARGRKGIYFLAVFITPLLFHSFVLAWKSERYILYLYTLFLVFISAGVVWAFKWLAPRIKLLVSRLGGTTKQQSAAVWLVGSLLAVVSLSNYQTLHYGATAFQRYHGITVPHNDWRGVAQYLKSRAAESDAIAASVPLAILYYLGRKPEYSIRRHEALTAMINSSKKPSGVHDRYTGSLILADEQMLLDAMAKHPRGWVVVDKPRWNKWFLTLGQMKLIKTKMRYHPNASDGTVLVYSWGQ